MPTHRVPALPVLVRVVHFERPAVDELALLDEQLLVRVYELPRTDPRLHHLHVRLAGIAQERAVQRVRRGVAGHVLHALMQNREHLAALNGNAARVPVQAEARRLDLRQDGLELGATQAERLVTCLFFCVGITGTLG